MNKKLWLCTLRKRAMVQTYSLKHFKWSKQMLFSTRKTYSGFKINSWNSLELLKIFQINGRHSSVVSSAPTILRHRVWIPSTPSMVFQSVVLNCSEKRTKRSKKRPGLAHFFKKMVDPWPNENAICRNYFLHQIVLHFSFTN